MPCSSSPATSDKTLSFDNPENQILSPDDGSVKGKSPMVDPGNLSRRPLHEIETATCSSAKYNGSSSSQQGDSHATATTSATQHDETIPEHTTTDPHYDDNLAGEVHRVQASVSSKTGETAMQAVTKHLNHTINAGFKGDAPECDVVDEMTPYVPPPRHEPFPMALVCRPPFGTPTNSSVVNPQNEAWLSALRNAKRSVFIQTPTLNAKPLIPAIVAACERGVDLCCYICLGYNDAVRLPSQAPLSVTVVQLICNKTKTYH